MKRAIGAILFVVYSIIAITVTVLLLSFNDYNCSELGGYTVYIVRDDSLDPEYKQGSVLLIKSTNDKHVEVGDELFFYKVINSTEYEFVAKTLLSKTQQGRHIVYNVDGDESFDTTYFVGKTEDVKIIDSPWGTILSILESKWGYLFCIVIVSLLLFLQEVFDLIIEIRYGGTKGTKAANIANARKAAARGGARATGEARNSTTAKAATATKTATKTATRTATSTKTTTAATAAKTVKKAVEVNNTESGVEEEV